MDSNIKLTTKQAEEKMKIYREVFDVVRIIKSTDIRRMKCGQEPELNENMCRCYDFWNKDKQCENCVSEKALTQKKQYTKLECLENDVYQSVCSFLNRFGGDIYLGEYSYAEEPTMSDRWLNQSKIIHFLQISS